MHYEGDGIRYLSSWFVNRAHAAEWFRCYYAPLGLYVTQWEEETPESWQNQRTADETSAADGSWSLRAEVIR